MNPSELLETIRDVLKNDQDIASFCTDKFLKYPTILLGVDDNSLPEASDYPVIAIAGIREVGGNAQNMHTWHVDIAAGVMQEEIITSETMGETQAKTFTGMLQAEDLKKLVEKAVTSARFAKISTDGESGSISFFPLYMSYTTITITTAAKRRRN